MVAHVSAERTLAHAPEKAQWTSHAGDDEIANRQRGAEELFAPAGYFKTVFPYEPVLNAEPVLIQFLF